MHLPPEKYATSQQDPEEDNIVGSADRFKIREIHCQAMLLCHGTIIESTFWTVLGTNHHNCRKKHREPHRKWIRIPFIIKRILLRVSRHAEMCSVHLNFRRFPLSQESQRPCRLYSLRGSGRQNKPQQRFRLEHKASVLQPPISPKSESLSHEVPYTICQPSASGFRKSNELKLGKVQPGTAARYSGFRSLQIPVDPKSLTHF
jgi:hypothetical protein